MEVVRTQYKHQLNDYLIKQTNDDSQKRYEAIEKSFSYCKAALAKEALNQWNQEVSLLNDPQS